MDDVTLERFLSKIRIADNGCWEWTGRLTPDGYGAFSLNGVPWLAHRLMWTHFVGKIPTGLTLDHLCHTRNLHKCPGGKDDLHRRCVCWVGHLEPVTNEENVRRGQGIFQVNARKTKCIWGHEYTPENTYYDPDGNRECRTCRHEASVAWMAINNPGVRHGTETHCPAGHEYAGANLIITSSGGRACRECKRASGRRQMRAKRVLERGYLPLPLGSVTCPVGHELAGDNSAVYAGQLVCLICMTPDGSRSKKGTEALIAAANGALNAMGVLF